MLSIVGITMKRVSRSNQNFKTSFYLYGIYQSSFSHSPFGFSLILVSLPAFSILFAQFSYNMTCWWWMIKYSIGILQIYAIWRPLSTNWMKFFLGNHAHVVSIRCFSIEHDSKREIAIFGFCRVRSDGDVIWNLYSNSATVIIIIVIITTVVLKVISIKILEISHFENENRNK